MMKIKKVRLLLENIKEKKYENIGTDKPNRQNYLFAQYVNKPDRMVDDYIILNGYGFGDKHLINITKSYFVMNMDNDETFKCAKHEFFDVPLLDMGSGEIDLEEFVPKCIYDLKKSGIDPEKIITIKYLFKMLAETEIRNNNNVIIIHMLTVDKIRDMRYELDKIAREAKTRPICSLNAYNIIQVLLELLIC